MNHRWTKDNKCANCGVSKVKRRWEDFELIVNGRVIKKKGTVDFYFGKEVWGFQRPECKKL